MNIHKFNAKPKTIPPKMIQWRPLREVNYLARKVNPMTWEIFSQQEIKLDPKEVKQIQLGLGFMMSEGVVLAALSNSLKYNGVVYKTKARSKTSGNTNLYVAFVIKNYYLIINGDERESISEATYSSSQ